MRYDVSSQDIYVVYVCVSRGLSGWLSGGTKPVFQTFKWYPFVWSQKTYTQNTVLFAFVWLVILYTTTYLSCVSYKRGPTNLYRIYWVLWYAMTTTTTFLFRVYGKYKVLELLMKCAYFHNNNNFHRTIIHSIFFNTLLFLTPCF